MTRASTLTLIFLVLMAPAPVASARDIGPITFDEVELGVGTVIDGRSIDTLSGEAVPTLTFGFAVSGVPSPAAAVIASAGTGTYYDGPLLSGPSSGELTIDFGADVKSVSFGFGFNTLEQPAGSCTLTAYEADGTPVTSVTRSATELDTFPNGQLTLTGAGTGAFRRVIVSFSTQAELFGFDNLLYELQPPPIPLIHGSGLIVLLVLLATLALLVLRRTAP